MAPVITPVSAIVGGRINFKLKVRLIHMWSITEYKFPNEEQCIHMLLLDERLGKIQATAKKSLVEDIKKTLHVGEVYEIENMLVTHNDASYAATKHKFRINLTNKTKYVRVTDSNIPMNHFDFVSFQEIMDSEKEDVFVDIIGHIVEKDPLKETEKNGKKMKLIDLTLEDAEGIRTHCTLWNHYAEQLNNFFATYESTSPVTVIMQLGKTKKFFGSMGVSNAFFGTKLIINGDLPAVDDYLSRIANKEVQLTQGVSQNTGSFSVPLSEDMMKTKMMTIEDVIESSEPCDVVVLARVCDIEDDSNWYYEACTKCATTVEVLNGKLYCPKCQKSKTAIPRYRIETQVMDMTGSTTFVLFDHCVRQFVGRSVQDMIESNNQNNKGGFPKDFDNLLGKQMLFKIEITEGHIKYNWRTYTAKRVSDDAGLIKRFIEHHKIKVSNEEEDAAYYDTGAGFADHAITTLPNIEHVDSTRTDTVETGDDSTPSSKSRGKRIIHSAVSDHIVDVEDFECSSSKPTKIPCVKVKIEKDD